MSTELIAALAAVAAALIAAAVSFAVNRDDRKKALDQAEVLVKLKAAMPPDADPVQDLEWILAHRTERWRRSRTGHDVTESILVILIAATLFWTVLVAQTVLQGDDLRSLLEIALQLVGLLAVVMVVAAFVTLLSHLPGLFSTTSKKRRGLGAERSDRPPPWSSPAPSPADSPHT